MTNTRLLLPLLVSLAASLTMPTAPAGALTWQIDTVDGPGDVGWFASIAIDANGEPGIAYCAPGVDDLKFARRAQGTWSVETVDGTGRTGWYTSLAFGRLDGHPRIAYWDLTNSSLRFARWTGSAWQKETVDNAAYVGQCCSLALDSSDNPRISYYDYTNGDLKYARWTGATWTVEVVDSGPAQLGTGLYTSITLDALDRPHISCADHTLGLLRYARWDGSAWIIETVDGGTPIGTSIVLDTVGNPRISYGYQFGQGSHLKYAVRSPEGAWTTQIVHTGGQVGLYSSLCLDTGGDPRILSWDLGHGIVQYYAHEDGIWTRDDIEAMGWTDQWCSLALDSGGNPLAAYRSASQLDLHVATGSSPASAHSASDAPLVALRVWPNPSRVGEPVTLQSSVPGERRVTIFDPRGRVVGAGGAELRIASDLPPGCYFARVDGLSGLDAVVRITRIPR